VAFLAQQLVVRALLNDPTLIKYIDHVGFLDGAKSMSNSDSGSTTSRSI
jgi:hypothetical protein